MINRIAVVPLAALLAAAAPGPQYVPLGKYDEAIVIPANSPVKFERFDRYDRARFSGRFLVEGVYVIECADCEPGYQGKRLHLSIFPDPPSAARLPHWKQHDNDIAIDISGAEQAIQALTTPAKRRLLMSSKLDEIRGRTAIWADRYEAGLDCDSANYSAHFVALAKPSKRAGFATGGDYGCGFI